MNYNQARIFVSKHPLLPDPQIKGHPHNLSYEKVKLQRYQAPKKIPNGKTLSKCKNQKLKHIKRMDNICHIPDLVHAFYCVENAD